MRILYLIKVCCFHIFIWKKKNIWNLQEVYIICILKIVISEYNNICRNNYMVFIKLRQIMPLKWKTMHKRQYHKVKKQIVEYL